MYVEDGLSRSATNVEYSSVSRLDAAFASELRGSELHVTEDLGVFGRSLIQAFNVLLGNDQYMCWRLRVDVFERKHLVVFINLLRRNFAGDELAE